MGYKYISVFNQSDECKSKRIAIMEEVKKNVENIKQEFISRRIMNKSNLFVFGYSVELSKDKLFSLLVSADRLKVS